MTDHYFIIAHNYEGTYISEHFDFHSACQECIEITDLEDVDCTFSSCDIIKGSVTNINN